MKSQLVYSRDFEVQLQRQHDDELRYKNRLCKRAFTDT